MALNKAKLAAELVGLGPGGGSLEKLTIRYRYDKVKKGKIEALFNPTEISISRSVSYEQKRVASSGDAAAFAVEQQLRSVEAATLSIELFFDTYESREPSLNPFKVGKASDVTHLTDRIARLAMPDRELHKPPVCHLKWGSFDIFDGVLTSLDQRFTMFLNDGTPVRATLSCTFVEFRTQASFRASEMHSADVAKTHTVRRHDTLQSIAAQHYGDPTLWRAIAKANRLGNPRDVQPGALLMIPRLRP